ncbi:UDP-N-acetylmuramoyl-L-alanyl-D-glutamate--2,6-diaminopimelate ligase [Vreelandella populi]|uniref:UDP-N-acetylmuramoyl-L-alanyl-D-glutamate--2,6-diaminopimelate ligase n=1 Tax=Vreelandella populi TaxID=2498858 RepID=A0A3S0YJ13_9GAMM|nr:UDP-N-acetylmuramoyl-L-alanyl-D-glutamate--2,6-diaminopimelate ligase [Halomonas populi]RUR42579.1 UDP-N-acetylmuramoyl-L-alanyl-D-glutamate--2,6-diaminopimelate ligase [Halomonas populi]RUR45818.1 UDP-N-acetylmuramoyl-L-alanyl-D-glutamate--2,6-diaminopimelate ligase [Halomonas populi]RUR57122.1 UDP-N-acetylmuramoyl-L-alanyl-D-glutamate--2,6-diaminopimelate ligase [Halomonas populi]
MTLTPNQLWGALGKVWPNVPFTALPELPETMRLITDSRLVNTGDVFVAVPGSQCDGSDFIDAALEQGALLVLAHARQSEAVWERRVVYLPHLAMRLGELGKHLFNVPNDLEIIGVTGTNGKSSVTHYIAALSETLGTPAGLVGTLGVGRPGQLVDTGLTTPGPLALQAALGELAQQGVRRVALEASSHALDQHRLDAANITVGVFTNLTRDHLDYHGSMAAYAAAKAKLFRRSELELAVVNADDPLARLMLAGCDSRVRVLATGQDEAVTFRVLDVQSSEAGQQALIATPEGERALALGLVGRFNLDNVLLAMAALYGLGQPIDSLFEAASKLDPVPGRMALYHAKAAPSVVIDYAHTPDALSNALEALRAHVSESGRLWCVFGCGGDRDTGKRPEMAKVVELWADIVVVTDDNPRSEPAEQIRQQIISGLSSAIAPLDIGDRRLAIDHVIQQASEGDVVLIAGKGHEAYQEINGVRHAYNDEDEVLKALAVRGSAP